MTNNKVSIRWKLCKYFIFLAVLLLLILWFMETVFLDSFYAFYTKQTMLSHSELIAENIDNPNINSLLISISQENEYSVYLLNEDGYIKSATERSTSVRVDKASAAMYEYWDLTSQNGGRYMTEIESSGVFTDSGDFLEYDPTLFSGNVPGKNSYRNLVVATEVVSAEGEHSLLVLLSRIDPISSMSEVFQLMLIVASFLALCAGIILAFFASKGLSKPLQNLSDSATELATGDYDVVFEAGGCRELSQLSDTLNNTTQQLRKTDMLRKELLANVSHDLRTPLTMIEGYGEMMRDIPGENNAENIQIIIDETKRLAKLVNDVLDFSKLQSGNFNFCPIVFCVTDDASEIVSQFEKLSAGKTKISFIESGDIYVNADEVLISEAIYNLVNNAVTHSGENTTVIVRQNVIGKNVRISVIDNGRGISPEMLDGIWERYQKGMGGGTGLGLAIVNTAVKMCGGTCGVESKLGKGSEFWIELPIYEK